VRTHRRRNKWGNNDPTAVPGDTADRHGGTLSILDGAAVLVP
jgi:hypothetical protein